MIKQEQIDINGTKFRRTYSDQHLMIERDGVRYCEAIDPLGFEERQYTETDEKFEVLEVLDNEEIN